MPFSRLIDHFERKAALCSSDGDLESLVGDAARELGFDYFALLHHSSLASPRHGLIRIDTYPGGWEEELVRHGLVGADPVHRASARTNIGFAWMDVPALIPVGPRGREIFERARRFDIGDGYTGAHAFGAARRIHHYPAAGRCPHLSRRERQCVRLLAAGKTDWEIAAILGISVETAHQYVKRARAAYDVVSRAQLVACVLRDALVSFDEAIPPDG
jgi:LuxR family quorum-sensing system transcriptional regulator CciR